MTEHIHVPPFVNYTCQQCGWCCRQYDISFSRREYERLSQNEWGVLEPTLAGKEWSARLPRGKGYAAYRLRYTPEGACVFLSPENTCRMHRHVGELGKTLGCCVFPFSFVSTPTGIYIGARFSCMATAYGLGEPVVRREAQLKKQLRLCREAGQVPNYGEEVVFHGRRTILWGDYLKLEQALIRTVLRDDLPIERRLLVFGKFIEILRNARLDRLRGDRFGELMELLENGLCQEATEDGLPTPPAGLWRVMFRQFCFQFTRRQGGAYREMSFAGRMRARLRQFWTGILFAAGRGRANLPALSEPVKLQDVPAVTLQPISDAARMALSRFLAAKLFGKQYFGRAFFNYSLQDGLNFLLMTAGAVAWFSRVNAHARGAGQAETKDVIEAIRYIDFCYGASATPAFMTSRIAVRLMGHGQTAARLAVSQYR